MPLAEQHGARIVPVDSEHSAIFQCLRGERLDRVRRVILTASGGPFLRASRAELESASPEAALKHPNWSMGPRISIGSATLMNKALELIELQHLFGLGRERIEVVIHPQSLVHSLVEFVDGSVIAQMGPPDMRLPIHYALQPPRPRARSARRLRPGALQAPRFRGAGSGPLPGPRAGLPLPRTGRRLRCRPQRSR